MGRPSLVLGTVQFGLDYGVANQNGKIDESEAERILDAAYENGIRKLDTAIAYGVSENILGKLNRNRFEIVTKLPPIPNDCDSPDQWVRDSIEASLRRLKVSKIKGLLLHDPSVLSRDFGKEVYAIIRKYIDEGKIEAFGLSIYSFQDLETVPNIFKYDIVQSPLNVFDQSLIRSGWLEKLKSKQVLVQVRSIFLQGLLLMDSLKRPQYFQKWKAHLDQWDRWLQTNSYNPLEVCIKYVRSLSNVDEIVFGVESTHHLREILSTFQNEFEISVPNTFVSEDKGLIDPSKWKLK
ncbi:aldo/keto reductase [Leptospira sp. 201903070]|uniref:Aldo/keto reductase n=1 Tax=Leptospira ainlahdjerensis TaxID=2810033 RepID=A0ABS2UAD8_9LEPT|nr:aldo/keto reductase [Leptospira ainlahdjerensis]MBM9577342.1 aldo/keto reductase [Leptospira ainlahdjerensis]